MGTFEGGPADWDEVRRCHDAWMEQGRLELLADDLSRRNPPNPELLKAIEQQVRALEPPAHAAQAA